MNDYGDKPTTYGEEGIDVLIDIIGETRLMMEDICNALNAIRDALIPPATTPDNNDNA